MRKSSLLIIYLFFLLFIFIGRAWATEYKISQITSTNSFKYSLQINNGQIVWVQKDSNGHNQIFFYNGTGTIQLSNNIMGAGDPHIDNGQVVWVGDDGGSRNIFLYNGTSTIQLTNSNSNDWFEHPQISNGQVAWENDIYDAAKDVNRGEIFFYDGSRTIQLSSNDYDNLYPSISNGQVVWYGNPLFGSGSSHFPIFFYNGSETVELTNLDEFNQWGSCLKIDNGKIIWEAAKSHGTVAYNQVFFYNGTSITQLTDENSRNWNSQIHNGQVVWNGYFGIDTRKIFFYDGNKTIALGRGTNPQIHNSQVVWEDYVPIGQDEIFFYDGAKVTQVTNNGYENQYPQISNGQIAWLVWDNNYNQIFLATPISGCTLDILNGADFTAGQEVSNNPEKLLDQRTFMRGVTTDGAARLLLRLNVDQINNITFTLDGTGNPNEDGILYNIDRTQFGNSVTVDTVETSEGKFAFVIYQAPENFVRQSQPQDKSLSERTLSIKIKANNSPAFEFSKDIKLVRPPIMLMHGLWSSEDMWNDFKSSLETNIPGIITYAIDYSTTNATYLASNEGLLHQWIKYLKCDLRAMGIAMVQADVFGHSMGGILARLHAANFGVYKRPDNFYMGDINKLITIDSPHQGSFLASIGYTALQNPNPLVQGWMGWLIMISYGVHRPINMGALEDLRDASPRIKAMNKIPINTPTHAIIGDYYVIGGNLDSIEDSALRILHKALLWIVYDTSPFIIQNRSDLVVSVESQSGKLLPGATDIFSHDHMHVTCNLTTNRALDLLNAAPEEPLFQTGFPIQEE